jgi:carbon-monoxide dehydrogenase medium subunit
VIADPLDLRFPADADEAVALLAEDPDGSRVLGGGTWVVPEMSRGVSRPRLIVDLRRAGLGGVRVAGDHLHNGATATYADLLGSDALARAVPLLRLVAQGITGGWAIRNQGTVGGSVAAARPQSDVPAALVASGAQAVVAGPSGRRSAPVATLFRAAMCSALEPGEVLVGFDVPIAPRWGAGYVKLKRGAGSWPIATAAALVDVDVDGRCTHATLVLGAVSATPLVVELHAVLVGERADPPALAAAAQRAAAALTDPWSDALAPGSYRAAVVGPIARRALQMAFDDIREAR